MGYLLVNVQLPDSASLERTKEVMDKCERIAKTTPGIKHTQAMTGQSLLLSANGSNFGSMFCILDPFDAAAGRTGACTARRSSPRRSQRAEFARARSPRR